MDLSEIELLTIQTNSTYRPRKDEQSVLDKQTNKTKINFSEV